MTTMVKEIYTALKEAGVSEDNATAAATVVAPRDELASKADLSATAADLRADIATVRSDLTMRMLAVALGQTALIVGLLRLFPAS
tara:strand:- start:18261 stop:18515 length:255 start_codon:yes stop_codon:yes gene_type:complete